MNLPDLQDIRIGLIGLGYVGLPLAVAFGRGKPTIGYDINAERIDELKAGKDVTLEVSREELNATRHLRFTADIDDLAACNVYIVTVPTPIDNHHRPNLRPLIAAIRRQGG